MIWSGLSGNIIKTTSYYLISPSFTLPVTGGYIRLLDYKLSIIDIVQWPATAAGKSYSRIADGYNDLFEVDPTPTKGYRNNITTGTIKINEIDYASGNQFIELYNTTTDTITLSNWTLRNSANNTFKFTRTIYPKAFTAIDASSYDNNSNTFSGQFGGGLNSSSDFVVLENPQGQIVDRVTWQSGSNYIYKNSHAVLSTYGLGANAGIAAPRTIGRQPVDGNDTFNNSNDFTSFSGPTFCGVNNNVTPAVSNTLNYPSGDNIYLPRNFKIGFKLGDNSKGSSNNTVCFTRTGGTTDQKSPHIYKLANMGIDLTNNLTPQTTVQAGLTFKDIDENALINGTIYKVVLNTTKSDNSGAAPQIVRNNITYDSSMHTIAITDKTFPYVNNGVRAAIMRIDITNTSPIGANNIEISSITVKFTNTAGANLLTADAQALFTDVSVYADNLTKGTTGSYQIAIDTQQVSQVTNANFNLTAGAQTFYWNSNVNNQVLPQNTNTYFLVANYASPNTFRAEITPGSHDTIWRDISTKTDQPGVPGTKVITSTPTIITPNGCPTSTTFPANVAAPGNGAPKVLITYPPDNIYAGTGEKTLVAIKQNGSIKWASPFSVTGKIVDAFETSYWNTEPPNSYIYIATDAGLLYKVQDFGGSGAFSIWAGQKNFGSAITSDLLANVWTTPHYLYFGTNNGRIYKIDSNGTEIWNTNPTISGGMRGTPAIEDSFSSPSINDLWTGTSNGYFYRLSNVDGSILSSSKTASGIYSSPFLASGNYNSSYNTHNVFFGDDTGVLRSRTSSNLKAIPALWNDLNTGARIRTSPYKVEKDTCVYFGNDNGMFYKVNYKDGSIIWTFKAQGPIRSMAVPGDPAHNDVYFGCDDGCFYGLNATTGKILSGYPVITGGEIRGFPVFIGPDQGVTGHSRIFFTSNDGNVYCIDLGY
jgi:outer membrane protein assembly factor BamB